MQVRGISVHQPLLSGGDVVDAAGSFGDGVVVPAHVISPELTPRADFVCSIMSPQLQPLVLPQVSHFSQVPLRTMVKFWHSPHMLPV
ncbi:hypothetical protein DFR52_101185 [Hoeflea marina]|uniref:Uncharacterized protein n=1 Tax=Hoeflea marina TaxID=274592 RepID=A0A317PSB9_9HYPH|nr:hypothetical protein DFR52_101185 [Hoeflea marina]